MTKYLIIGPSWIGDMIMANALFRLLKANQADCIIDVLAPEWSHAVIHRMPEVRQALIMPLKHGAFNLLTRYKLGQLFKEEHYDQAIVLPNSWKSALIPFFAHIPKRIGWKGEWRYGLLNDVRVLNPKNYSRMIERYLALGLPSSFQSDFLLKKDYFFNKYMPCLTVNKRELDLAIHKYAINLNKPLLILCPGAQYGGSKRWPEHYFASLAKYYLEKDWQVAILGGKGEIHLAKKILNQLSRELNPLNKLACFFDLTLTTLAEAIDIMSLAKVVVSNDSGLMHMASALNKPIIAIYGSSPPDFAPPLGDKTKILSKNLSCKPCFKRECPLGHLQCLNSIKPEEVIHSINELI